jgi:hypothetical protein
VAARSQVLVHRVRIPLGARTFVLCLCCVVLATRPGSPAACRKTDGGQETIRGASRTDLQYEEVNGVGA